LGTFSVQKLRMPCASIGDRKNRVENMYILTARSNQLRKYRQLLHAMTMVIARADRLGHEPLIAVMDELKTAIAQEAAVLTRGRLRRLPRLR
jgi:hypothetical protein